MFGWLKEFVCCTPDEWQAQIGLFALLLSPKGQVLILHNGLIGCPHNTGDHVDFIKRLPKPFSSHTAASGHKI